MKGSVHSSFPPGFVFTRLVPIGACTLYAAALVLGLSMRTLWRPLPENAAIINLDPLQSLAFLVAWSGLVGAIAVSISNKFKDLTAIHDETTLLINETGSILRDTLSRQGESPEPGGVSHASPSWIRKPTEVFSAILQSIGLRAQRWQGWVYFLCAVPYAILRLNWAMNQVDLVHVDGGINTFPVPSGAAVVFLVSWSLLMIAVIERAVYVWRTYLDSSKNRLLSVRGHRDEAVKLSRNLPGDMDE